MYPSLLLWPGLPGVSVVEIVNARAVAKAARLVVQPTGKVPASSAKVPVASAVEAASMNSSSRGPLSWPSPVVDVVEIVETRAAAAWPVVQP